MNDSNTASIIDTTTNALVASLPIPYGLRPQRAAVAPSTNRVLRP